MRLFASVFLARRLHLFKDQEISAPNFDVFVFFFPFKWRHPGLIQEYHSLDRRNEGGNIFTNRIPPCQTGVMREDRKPLASTALYRVFVALPCLRLDDKKIVAQKDRFP